MNFFEKNDGHAAGVCLLSPSPLPKATGVRGKKLQNSGTKNNFKNFVDCRKE
jgi:hypothetical protein